MVIVFSPSNVSTSKQSDWDLTCVQSPVGRGRRGQVPSGEAGWWRGRGARPRAGPSPSRRGCCPLNSEIRRPACMKKKHFEWQTWNLCTGRPDRMSHRKLSETKHQQLIWWPDLALLGCCLVYLHFLCDILSGFPVQRSKCHISICRTEKGRRRRVKFGGGERYWFSTNKHGGGARALTWQFSTSSVKIVEHTSKGRRKAKILVPCIDIC